MNKHVDYVCRDKLQEHKILDRSTGKLEECLEEIKSKQFSSDIKVGKDLIHQFEQCEKPTTLKEDIEKNNRLVIEKANKKVSMSQKSVRSNKSENHEMVNESDDA